MPKNKEYNVNLIARGILLFFSITLFLIFFYLFTISYEQYEKLELRARDLVEKFNESQADIDQVYQEFNTTQHAFNLFSMNHNSYYYNDYMQEIYLFKSILDTIITRRKNYINNNQLGFISLEEHSRVLKAYIKVNNNIDSTIQFSKKIGIYFKNNKQNLSSKEKKLLNENFNLIYAIDQSIVFVNNERLKVKKDLVKNDKQELFKESREHKIQTFLCLFFMFILIAIIIYYQFFTSFYNRRLKNEKLYTKKLTDSKSKILTEITHEIRTPINALIGALELLKKKKNLYNEEDIHLVESVYTSIINTSKTINDILNSNTLKSTNSNFQTFDIEEIIIDIIELHKSQAKLKNINLTYTLDKDSPRFIFTDEVKLKQILTNLISNSIKYSNKGTIHCNIQNQHTGLLRIKINDEGIGIPHDLHQNIYKKYFTVNSDDKHSNGLGLGLFVTKRIIKSLNGTINLINSNENGSIFIVEIPIPRARYRSIDSKKYNSLNELPQNISWLIVDDNALNILYLKQFFSNFPNVKIATNGLEALKIVDQENIDIIITDINMPLMTGDELLLKIRAIQKYDSIKVIATSSDNEQVKELEIKNNCYFDNILTKPFTEKDLIKTIVNTLRLE